MEAATRGDGDTGENITHNVMGISGIPDKISYKDRLVVTGEAFIRPSDFEALKDTLRDGNGEPYNFGPQAEQTKTVFELVQDLASFWGLDRDKAAKQTGDIPFEEATLLKLNCDKALAYLHWHSTLHYKECVRFIAEWYYAFYVEKDKDMYALTEKQIREYISEAKKQNLEWAF